MAQRTSSSMTKPPRDSASSNDVETKNSESSNSVYAAAARTAGRGVGLYFARPMRLFRPTKISGWTTLRHAAASEGTSLSPSFVSNLIRTQGLVVIPRHFFPPLLVNTVLGTLLFTGYTTAYDAIHQETRCPNSTVASAIAGAAAGAVQSIAGAPAENVKILLEGGMTGKQSSVHGWRQAWKNVFVDSSRPNVQLDKKASRQQAREMREWMKEVGDMAGRGWDGWRWSCAKDACGFALFFAVFDISRQIATYASEQLAPRDSDTSSKTWRPFSGAHRIAQSIILVSGGVIGGLGHEIVGRPFDISRRLLYLNDAHVRAERAALSSIEPSPRPGTNQVSPPRRSFLSNVSTSFKVLRDTAHKEGYLYFFKSPMAPTLDSNSSPYRRLHTALRTLGRVGPWGAAFVVWEATGGVAV